MFIYSPVVWSHLDNAEGILSRQDGFWYEKRNLHSMLAHYQQRVDLIIERNVDYQLLFLVQIIRITNNRIKDKTTPSFSWIIFLRSSNITSTVRISPVWVILKWIIDSKITGCKTLIDAKHGLLIIKYYIFEHACFILILFGVCVCAILKLTVSHWFLWFELLPPSQ